MGTLKGLKRTIKSVYTPLCQSDYLLAQPKVIYKQVLGKRDKSVECVNELSSKNFQIGRRKHMETQVKKRNGACCLLKGEQKK